MFDDEEGFRKLTKGLELCTQSSEMKNTIPDEVLKRAAAVLIAVVVLLLCVGFNYFITKEKARADQIRLEKQIEQAKIILKHEKKQLDERRSN